jgi:hypothetical protein
LVIIFARLGKGRQPHPSRRTEARVETIGREVVRLGRPE